MRFTHWMLPLSLVALVGFAVGCGEQGDYQEYSEVEEGAHSDEHDHDHDHAHEGAHGGHIIEFSDDHSLHGEFVVDKEAGMAMLYLTGSDLKEPKMATEVMFDLETENAEGEEEEQEFEMEAIEPNDGGEASTFSLALETLPTDDIEAMHGHFHIMAGGESYDGDLTHDHDHDHGDHDHGDHDHEEGEEHSDDEESDA
ncbi:hypothetical protein Pan189_11590 [Stratiformator vulcanicus]|uniref:Uncharacterized protein n=2 Tax=Stratiformator vulcanicus TaxID=2527980 RepID=A0A517QYR8_9PLAN|nr:hypothetical protein Pan189_11590 [Stratiformator vulcanicus]